MANFIQRECKYYLLDATIYCSEHLSKYTLACPSVYVLAREGVCGQVTVYILERINFSAVLIELKGEIMH